MKKLHDTKEKFHKSTTGKQLKSASSTYKEGLKAVEEEEKKKGNANPRVTNEQLQKQQMQSRQKQLQQRQQQNRQRQNVQAQQNKAKGNTYDQSRQTRGNQRKRREDYT